MRIFSRKKRPMHLGRYPMEKIRRVDRPTTLITDDVKQVPKRAGFFVRAFYGDLGPKPAQGNPALHHQEPAQRGDRAPALEARARPTRAIRRTKRRRSPTTRKS